MNIIRFDKLEFDVLDAANNGRYSLKNPMKDRALLLMIEGILQNNPLDNWGYSGWRFTDRGRLYYGEFLQAIRDRHGHQWMTNHDSNPDLYDENSNYGNEINIFAYETGYHNGMVCKNCGFGFCHHCTSEFEIEECDKT